MEVNLFFVPLDEKDISLVSAYYDIQPDNFTSPDNKDYKVILIFNNKLFSSNFFSNSNSTLWVESTFSIVG